MTDSSSTTTTTTISEYIDPHNNTTEIPEDLSAENTTLPLLPGDDEENEESPIESPPDMFNDVDSTERQYFDESNSTTIPSSAPTALIPADEPSNKSDIDDGNGGGGGTSWLSMLFIFIMIIVFMFYCYRKYKIWKQRREETAQQLRSQQVDRVLNEMQLVPNEDLDNEMI